MRRKVTRNYVTVKEEMGRGKKESKQRQKQHETTDEEGRKETEESQR